MTAQKKQRERKVFDMVYGTKKFDQITESESPDFLVRHFGQTLDFGVEVTELYLSETDARLEHLENYVRDLLEGAKFRHKADRQALTKIDLVRKESGDLVEKDIPAIFQEVPSFAVYAGLIASRVREKAGDAVAALSHTNLIIFDRTEKLRSAVTTEVCRLVHESALWAALSESPFREIFLVATIHDQLGYVPLKMVYLIANVFAFEAALLDLDIDSEVSADSVELFAALLAERVKLPVLIHKHAEGTEAIFGDTGIIFGRGIDMTVRMHSDYPVPIDAVAPTIEWKAALGAHFADAFDQFRSTHAFVAPILFPITVEATDCKGPNVHQ